MDEVLLHLTSQTVTAIFTWQPCLVTIVDPIAVSVVGSILFLMIWGYSWYLGFHRNFFVGGADLSRNWLAG